MNEQNDDIEMLRMKYAYRLALFGLGLSVILVVVLVFVAGMRTSADIVAIVGVFTSVTGTLVGAFFGLQIGSAGRAQERQERIDAEKMARMAFGMMSLEQAKTVMEIIGKDGV